MFVGDIYFIYIYIYECECVFMSCEGCSRKGYRCYLYCSELLFLDFVLICNVYCMINFVYFLAFVS